jgi:hypothetical protein
MPVATALRVTHWRRESVILSPGGELKILLNQSSLSGHPALRTRVNQNAHTGLLRCLVVNMKASLQLISALFSIACSTHLLPSSDKGFA